MTLEQRTTRFCIPCGTSSNHTSLDHRYCPQKRSTVQARIKSAREERTQTKATTERVSILIKKKHELSNIDKWPTLRVNQEQKQKTSTIILLALLDDSKQPGIFQHKFSQALQNNGLPDVKYTPELGTAEMIKNTFCASNMRLQQMSFSSGIPGLSGDLAKPTIATKVTKVKSSDLIKPKDLLLQMSTTAQ